MRIIGNGKDGVLTGFSCGKLAWLQDGTVWISARSVSGYRKESQVT